MVYDLDRPFGGVNKLEPVELARIMIGLEEDYIQFTSNAPLPCGEEGATTR